MATDSRSSKKQVVYRGNISQLRDQWEELSFQLELEQCSRECVMQEKTGMIDRKPPPYKLTFDTEKTQTIPHVLG